MQIIDKRDGRDGAILYLFELQDKSRVEAVLLDLIDNNKDSLCVSSQVGCALGCRFCSTGQIGFRRNLTSEEIAFQVKAVLEDANFVPQRRFDLSYMGMGEPLQNLGQVLASKRMIEDAYQNFHFYISTAGLPSGIRRLAVEAPDVKLQISLHSPRDAVRKDLIPLNTSYPIDEVISAAVDYGIRTGSIVTLNYCFMAGVNDSLDDARLLAALVEGKPLRVQLVNFNSHSTIPYRPTDLCTAEAFFAELSALGVAVHLGRQLGGEVGAGCGQLDADYRAEELKQQRHLRPAQHT